MVCSCRLWNAPSVRTNSPERIPLSGTFDFRWPRKTKIRVAFQRFDQSPRVVNIVRDLVAEALEAWGVHQTLQKDGLPLTYAMVNVENPFPAGDYFTAAQVAEEKKSVDARIASAKSDEDKKFLKADFDAFAKLTAKGDVRSARPAEAALADATSAFPYDVLICVAPFPLVIPSSKDLKNPAQVLTYAQSELGAYARRQDLGLPTCYLGRPYAFQAPEGQDPDEAWFSSVEGRFTVFHEIGHMLGLGHEHQNPNRTLDWKAPEEIAAIIERRRGIRPVRHDFIAQEITDRFARLPGAEDFSQWRNATAAETAGGPIDSVMVEPIYRCLLKGPQPHREPDASKPGACPYEQELYELLSKGPTPSDLAQLRVIYPPI